MLPTLLRDAARRLAGAGTTATARTYDGELAARADRTFIPVAVIAALAMWPYFSIDAEYFPGRPEFQTIRLSLVLLAVLGLVLRALPWFRRRGTLLWFLLAGWAEIVIGGVLCGLAGAEPGYMNGYVMLIILLLLVPVRIGYAYAILAASIAAFLATLWLTGVDVGGPGARNTLFNLAVAVVFTVLFVWVFDRLRQTSFAKSRQLEEERNKLSLRDEAMTRELLLARRIQQRLIPARTPGREVAAVYRPVAQVGGDFYDFIPFPEAHRFGVFISDVSGHGVPSALVTSMVKSSLAQAAEQHEDPAALLATLNQLLWQQTDDNYVTAYYGVVDLRARTVKSANAGHPAPYLVGGGRARAVEQAGRGVPLGVLPTAELAARGKAPANDLLLVAPGDRLVLYTDGLTEACAAGAPDRDFAGHGLDAALVELAGLPTDEYAASLVSRLAGFRGVETFEDDVCLVCVAF